MKPTYAIILILGIVIGAAGMQIYLYSTSTNDDRFQVGDYVQTTSEWDDWYTPLSGNVTDIEHYRENTLIVIDGNYSRQINQDWFMDV